jgi:transcriptional regulator with XRE-family HTH domain
VSESELHYAVAERIKELADARGLTINRLADFAGMSRGYLSKLLRGEQSPTVRSLERIAAALEVEVRDLFPKPRR